jgi:hypothetical protein
MQPRWSPDGKRIFHVNSADDTSGDWASGTTGDLRRLAIAPVPAEGGNVTPLPLRSAVNIRLWAELRSGSSAENDDAAPSKALHPGLVEEILHEPGRQTRMSASLRRL